MLVTVPVTPGMGLAIITAPPVPELPRNANLTVTGGSRGGLSTSG